MSDEATIDVGPVSCPACRRPYASASTLTEEERELMRSCLLADPRSVAGMLARVLDRLSGSTSTGGPTEQHDENCPAVCPWVGGDCYAPEHDDHACSCPASCC